MDNLQKIIVYIIILIIIVNLMPKNENFAMQQMQQMQQIPQQSTGPVYLYNDHYKMYLHLTDNDQLHLMKIKPEKTKFNLVGGYIKSGNSYISKFDDNPVYNINPLLVNFVANPNENNTFRLLDNYINYTSPDGVLPLTINNNDTFNIIKYDPLYKLDSKNKFIVL